MLIKAAPKTVPMSARQKELIAWGLRGGKDLVAPTQTQEKKADTASDQADCGIPDDDPASPAPEQRKAVSRLGGLRAAAAHRWDSIAASLAGRKGGGKRWLNRPNRVA